MAVNEVIWIIFVSFHVICFLLLIPSYIYIIWETKSDYFGIGKLYTGLNEKDMAAIERYKEINKNHSDLMTVFLWGAPIYRYKVGSFRWIVVLLSGFIPSYFLGLIMGLILANIISLMIDTISPYNFPQGTLFGLDNFYAPSIIAGLVFWWLTAKVVKFLMNLWSKNYTPTKSSKSKKDELSAVEKVRIDREMDEEAIVDKYTFLTTARMFWWLIWIAGISTLFYLMIKFDL